MIAIIGAGITGLATAYHLSKAGIPFRLYEASDRVGGNLRSVRSHDCLLEKGPNSLLMNDRIYGLLAELGIENEVVKADSKAKYRYVLRGQQYKRMPAGPVSFLFGGFFSGKEKLRIWRERKLASRSPEGESVDAFFRRRFGDAVADYLLTPFVAGIYAGDPRMLEMEAAFARFREMEVTYGSVIRGFMKGGPRDQHRGIFSLKTGLERLPAVLAEQISGHIVLNAPVSNISKSGNGFTLTFVSGMQESFSKVIFTSSAPVLADLFATLSPELSAGLREVYYPPVVLVHTLWKKDQIKHPLDGFGALHNAIEPSNTLGTIFSSSVFPDRNPNDTVLLTSFVGGARDPKAALAGEKAVLEGVRQDLGKFLGAEGQPVWGEVALYEKAIPQYRPGIRQLWAKAKAWETQGIYLAGNWVGGISVPNCLDNARVLCEKLIESKD